MVPALRAQGHAVHVLKADRGTGLNIGGSAGFDGSQSKKRHRNAERTGCRQNLNANMLDSGPRRISQGVKKVYQRRLKIVVYLGERRSIRISLPERHGIARIFREMAPVPAPCVAYALLGLDAGRMEPSPAVEHVKDPVTPVHLGFGETAVVP